MFHIAVNIVVNMGFLTKLLLALVGAGVILHKTVLKLVSVGNNADIEQNLSFDVNLSGIPEAIIRADVKIKNPTQKQITIGQPYIRIHSKPENERTKEYKPVATSNISDRTQVLKPKSELSFEPIIIKIGALSAVGLFREMIKAKKVRIFTDTVLQVGSFNTTIKEEVVLK